MGAVQQHHGTPATPFGADFCDGVLDRDAAEGNPRKIPRVLHEPHVFLYAGKPLSDIRDGISRACKKAKIPYGRHVAGGFVFHDLRHTFVTNMRRAGVHDTVIILIKGHNDLAMFRRYNLVDGQDAELAGDKLTNYLMQ